MTRRDFYRLFGAAFLPACQRLVKAAGETGRERRYRVDAQVLLLSLPVMQRSGVGSGTVVWREKPSPGGQVRVLEFGAYSLPDRAAGLNRVGLIREQCCLENGCAREAQYFGVMTASPEESAGDARKALNAPSAETVYTAIRGHIRSAQAETATANFTAPARLSTDRRAELLARAEQALSAAPPKPLELRTGSQPPRPFLHALADALSDPAQTQTSYLYGGRLYQMTLRRCADPHAAAYFREKGLLPQGAKLTKVSGKVRRASGGPETEFHVWVEPGVTQPIPLRIDFQPKSYLRLTLEAEA